MGKSISRDLEEKLDKRETFLSSRGERNFISIAEGEEGEYIHEAVSAIICEGDVIGAVILLNNDQKSKMGEVEQKLVLSASSFLGRQMQS